MPDTHDRELTESQEQWLRVREYLRVHRFELAGRAARELYSDIPKVAGTPLLAMPTWVPDSPKPLESIDLEFAPATPFAGLTGTEDVAASVLPTRPDGSRYHCYADVIADLAVPAVFENRETYRLLDADLSGPRGRLVFGRGTYFDGVNTGEACAHEYAARCAGHRTDLPLRSAIGDLRDPRRRPVNLAISTLTIRYDHPRDEATCFLHWRDPAKVGHAGGLYQVIPVGIFQPSGAASWNEANDFSLWRCMIREFAEELNGESEDHQSEQAPIDYDAWPFAAQITKGRREGTVRAYCLGLGVDPLTAATDLLTAVVIDAPVFDDLFGEGVRDNAEGQVLTAQPFTADSVARLIDGHPMQAAGAAVLRLAGDLPLVGD